MGTMTESERLDSLESRVIKLESRMTAPAQMPPRPQQKTDPVLRGWRPIESAPKDGTEISVAFKSVGVRQVSWQDPYGDDDDCALWCVDDNKHGPYPLRGYSHGDELGWMPLPEPPEVK